MKLVIIIALAFVLLVPSVAFAEEFRYDWLETWEKLGISGTTQLQGIICKFTFITKSCR